MSKSDNDIVKNFYSAFQNRDAYKMVKNYHPDLQFHDPAFGKLNFRQTSAMWKMLCESGQDLKIEFEILEENDDIIKTKWIASYSFGKSKRPVRNEIIALMNLKDGLIIKHDDYFNLHRWARQALGFKGLLLGGTTFFRNQLQQQTGRRLQKFMQQDSGLTSSETDKATDPTDA